MFSLAKRVVLALVIGMAVQGKVSAQDIIVNGGFETGDYTGWTLLEEGRRYTDGTWAIARNGETINRSQDVFDFCDSQLVRQYSSCLPYTFQATAGTYLAIQLQNYMVNARMYQDITLPANATALRWDMAYTNLASEFASNQFAAIHLRDLNDLILETLFITGPGSPPSVPMSPYSVDITGFAGKTVRLDVEVGVGVNFFPISFDNFLIETAAVPDPVPTRERPVLPPGWGLGEKRGWEGSLPPGLEKKAKIPAGFEMGNKKGFDK